MPPNSAGDHANTNPLARSGRSVFPPFSLSQVRVQAAERRELEAALIKRDGQLREMIASQRQGGTLPEDLLEQVNLSDKQLLCLYSYTDLEVRHDEQQVKFRRLLVGDPVEEASAKPAEAPGLLDDLIRKLSKPGMLGSNFGQGRKDPNTAWNVPSSAPPGPSVGFEAAHGTTYNALVLPAATALPQQPPPTSPENTWQTVSCRKKVKTDRGGSQNSIALRGNLQQATGRRAQAASPTGYGRSPPSERGNIRSRCGGNPSEPRDGHAGRGNSNPRHDSYVPPSRWESGRGSPLEWHGPKGIAHKMLPQEYGGRGERDLNLCKDAFGDGCPYEWWECFYRHWWPEYDEYWVNQKWLNAQQMKQPYKFEPKPPDHEWTKQPANSEDVRPRRLRSGKLVYGNSLKDAVKSEFSEWAIADHSHPPNLTEGSQGPISTNISPNDRKLADVAAHPSRDDEELKASKKKVNFWDLTVPQMKYHLERRRRQEQAAAARR
ncbi:hypothetical protein K491DRAFT_405973 [Lophiostoma macrostomum CBS 122681]|uniref:Uncharacterized protein n=1 Tax=Lophiostoma macrostomum CBS 122681 TaxID=1314788 RepID=A0A6A6T7H8_9PLEO|nr:hypothetical protein K491DRAFT_405973 [Lophiostoma macrostomum CBS 122681]